MRFFLSIQTKCYKLRKTVGDQDIVFHQFLSSELLSLVLTSHLPEVKCIWLKLFQRSQFQGSRRNEEELAQSPWCLCSSVDCTLVTEGLHSGLVSKESPALQEMQAWSPPGEGKQQPYSSNLAWEIPWWRAWRTSLSDHNPEESVVLSCKINCPYG